jgi:small-conductance mechanosensitive channel
VLSRPLVTLGKTPISIVMIFSFFLVIVIVAFLAKFTRVLSRKYILSRTKLTPSMQYTLSRIASYLVLGLGLLIGFQAVGIELSSLTVLVGALGVGLGFGLQDVVKNFVSGLIILTEQPIRVGDRIEVDHTSGQITHIGLRSTTIRTNDDVLIIMPNAKFISDKVTNWTRESPKIRLHIPVEVDNTCDMKKVETLLLEVAKENDKVLDEPPAKVFFTQFGDNGLDVELRLFTKNVHHLGSMKSDLNFAIWKKFTENKIDWSNPQRDLHFREKLRIEMARVEDHGEERKAA